MNWRQYRLRPHQDFENVEAWLHSLDSTPHVVPLWPESRRMALVACVTAGDGEAEAYVLANKSQVDTLFKNLQSEMRRSLFFVVPKTYVLADAVRPDGLEADAWK